MEGLDGCRKTSGISFAFVVSQRQIGALLARSVHEFARRSLGCSISSRWYYRALAASEAGRTARADLSGGLRFA
jgi:hypothetical protein